MKKYLTVRNLLIIIAILLLLNLLSAGLYEYIPISGALYKRNRITGDLYWIYANKTVKVENPIELQGLKYPIPKKESEQSFSEFIKQQNEKKNKPSSD